MHFVGVGRRGQSRTRANFRIHPTAASGPRVIRSVAFIERELRMKLFKHFVIVFLAVAFYVIPVSAQNTLLKDDLFENIAMQVGGPKRELINKLGEPWREQKNEFGTEFLYYGNLYALFTIDAKSGRVVYASYPIADVDGKHQSELHSSYMSIIRGMTKEMISNKLGEPSTKATRVWVFEKLSRKSKCGGKTVLAVAFDDNGRVEGLEFRWIASH